MKKTIFFFLMVVLSLGARGQTVVAYVTDTAVVKMFVYDGDTTYHPNRFPVDPKGKWMIYYDTSRAQLAAVVQYKGNRRNEEHWYRNGKPKKILISRDSLPGIFYDSKKWYANGEIKMVETSTRDSCIIKYYYPGGQLKKEHRSYIDTALWNTSVPCYVVEYYENGHPKCSPWDPNAAKRYHFVCYYPSGAKKDEGDWWHGNIGPYYEWYEDGTLKTSGEYIEDGAHRKNNYIWQKKTGTWIYYDKSGRRQREEIYQEDGTFDWKEFDGEGNVVKSGISK